MEKQDRTLAPKIAIVSSTILLTIKIVAGIISNSLGVISEGLHSFTDLLASTISYFSVKTSSQPADRSHPFGHGKYENIGSVLESGLIVVIGVYVVYKSVTRLMMPHSPSVEPVLGIIVMVISVIANIFVSSFIFKEAKKYDSPALESDAWHIRSDVYTDAGVCVGLLLIKFTGVNKIDSIIALIVGVYIIYLGFSLFRKSFHMLVDTKLPEEDEKIIAQVLDRYANRYLNYHRLRTRKAGAHRYIDLHLVIPCHTNTEQAHTLCELLEDDLGRELRNLDVLIHVEPCDGNCRVCAKKDCVESKKNDYSEKLEDSST